MDVHTSQDQQGIRARIDGNPLFRLTPEERTALLQRDPTAANEVAELLYNTPSLYGKAMQVASQFAGQDGRLTAADSVRVAKAPQRRPDGVVFWETFRAAFCGFSAGENGSFCAYFSVSLRRAMVRELQKEQDKTRYLKSPTREMKKLLQTIQAINDKRQELGLAARNPRSDDMVRAAAELLGKKPAAIRKMLDNYTALGTLTMQEYDEDGTRKETAEEADHSMDPQELLQEKEDAAALAEQFRMLSLREKELNFERYGDLYSDNLLRFLRGNNEGAAENERRDHVLAVQPLEREGLFWGRMMQQEYAEFLLAQPPALDTVPPLAFNPLKDPALKPSNAAVARFRLRNKPDGSFHSEEVKVGRDVARLKAVFQKILK